MREQENTGIFHLNLERDDYGIPLDYKNRENRALESHRTSNATTKKTTTTGGLGKFRGLDFSKLGSSFFVILDKGKNGGKFDSHIDAILSRLKSTLNDG